MSRIRRFAGIHFLGLELTISVVLSIFFSYWVIWHGGAYPVDSVVNGNRGAIYGTLASILGSLLGFVITALSIIIGYSTSDKFEFLRKAKPYPTLWEVLLSTIKFLSLATISMIVGLIFDRDSSPNNFILCFCVFTVVISLLRLKRCLWVLENVVHIVIKEPSN